jgi:hypothetical protein
MLLCDAFGLAKPFRFANLNQHTVAHFGFTGVKLQMPCTGLLVDVTASPLAHARSLAKKQTKADGTEAL